jgi:hypothetical protein
MHIDSYSFGNIIIDGKSYSNDVIIYPGGIHKNWFRREGHVLCLDDIEEYLVEDCKTLIMGTGTSGMVRILPEVEEFCANSKIQLITHPTAKAVELFNNSDKTSTVGAFHLTC